MDPSRRERIKEVFETALRLAPSEGKKFLEAACGGDADLRAEVDSLIAGHEKAGDFLEHSPAAEMARAGTGTAPLTFSPGDIVCDRFRVIRFIGEGGMGEVYEAEDLHLRVRVALKTIRPDIASDPRNLRRFTQEVQLARHVTHPNVCRMFDLERHRPPVGSGKPEVVFLTMELLEGETLRERLLRRGRMTSAQALPLVLQMAEGLAAAHQVGVIHRDFKPGNAILVRQKAGDAELPLSQQPTASLKGDQPASPSPDTGLRAVITDFGLAKVTPPFASPTLMPEIVPGTVSYPGEIVGTPPYMAPEQLLGHQLTPATDVYALGLVIYEMVTGTLLFAGDKPVDPDARRLKELPPPLHTIIPDVDNGLESVTLRCLQTDPASRYASAREVVAALQGETELGRRVDSRWPKTLVAAFGLALAVILALVVLHLRVPDVKRVTVAFLSGLFDGHPNPTEPAVATSSAEARRRYLRAAQRYAARDLPGSIGLAQSALELDPNFAMAHLLLAKSYDQAGNEKKAKEHLALALQTRAHVSERERHLIVAYEDYVQNLFQDALDQYRLLLELNPNDLEALRGVASTGFWVSRVDEAIQAQGRVLQLNPSYAVDYTTAMHLLSRSNRFQEALSVYDQARVHGVESPEIHWAAALAYWGEDDTTQARRELDVLRKGGGTREADLAGLYLARLLIYEGRMREADEALQTGLILDQQQHSETWIPLRRYLLAKGDLVRGDVPSARNQARLIAIDAQGQPAPERLNMSGLLAIELGDLASAWQDLNELDELRKHQNSTFVQYYFYLLKGDVELAEGKLREAGESERRALMLFSSYGPHAILAKVCAANHDWQGAINAYEAYLKFKGEILRDDFSGDWVLAHLELARAYAKAGNARQAELSYDEFLRLWRAADPDLPVLRQAIKEKQSLRSSLPAQTRHLASNVRVEQAKLSGPLSRPHDCGT